MKVYRLHRWSDAEGSEGFGFYWSKRDARKALVDWLRTDGVSAAGRDDLVDSLSFQPTKAGISSLLRWAGSHPDNG